MNSDERQLRQFIDSQLPSPSNEETEAACNRVRSQLRLTMHSREWPSRPKPARPWRAFVPIRFVAAAVFAVVLSLALLKTFIFPGNIYATVQNVDGPLYRVTGTERQGVKVGDRIDSGKVLRTGSSAGAVLALSDGSRVEMRSQTELSVERADGRVRIRLNEGSVLVTPSRESTQTLYVLTAQSETPVTSMLFQSAPAPSTPAADAKSEGGWQSPALRFEAVSLRPVSQAPVVGTADRLFRCKGVDGMFHATTGALQNLSILAADLAALPAAAVPLGRCVGIVHPRQLIAQAYNLPNPTLQVASDFDWPENYQIEAKVENPASTTKAQIREMLQSLLADRYGFRMHMETREGPGCILRISKNGAKLKPTSEEEGVSPSAGPDPTLPETYSGKFRMKTFADSLFMVAGGVRVIDQTGLPGVYDITLKINRGELGGGPSGGGNRGGGGPRELKQCNSNFSKILEDQLGLVLERAMVPTEHLIVDHIEKPREN